MHPGASTAVAQVVTVGFHRAERDAPEAVDFEDALRAAGGGADEDIGLLADANARAEGVDDGFLEVRMQREVVESAIG